MELNPPEPLFEEIELMDDAAPHDAATNMAFDEVLLNRLRQLPLLRIYRWRAPAVSFGCFEPVETVRQRFAERELVRRWTGGGVVEHGDDLTYSVLAPRTFPLSTMPARESYRLVHTAVARALRAAGLDARLVEAGKEEARVSAACFENPVCHDVIFENSKIAGAAQRRTRHGLLHQGSIHLSAMNGRKFSSDDLRLTLAGSLAAALAGRLQPRSLRPEECHAADVLAQSKYGAKQWLEKF